MDVIQLAYNVTFLVVQKTLEIHASKLYIKVHFNDKFEEMSDISWTSKKHGKGKPELLNSHGTRTPKFSFYI